MKRYIAAILVMVMLCMCSVAYADITVQNDRISAYMDSTGGVVLTGYNERINATDAYDLICIDAGRISYMVENDDGTRDILHADFATSTERVLVENIEIACGYDGAGIYYVSADEPGSVWYITFSGKKTLVYSSEEEVKYLQRSHHGLIIGFAEQAGAMLYDDTFGVVSPFNGLIGTDRRIMSDASDLVLTSDGALYIDDSTAAFPSMISSGVEQFECIEGVIYYIIGTETDRSLMQYAPSTLSWQEVVMPAGKTAVSITTSYTQALVMDNSGVVYTINNANCAVSPFANITVPAGVDIENVFIEGVSGQLNVYSEEPEQEQFVLAFNFTMNDSDNNIEDEEGSDERGKITLLATCELETEMTTFDVLTPAALYETLRYGSRGDAVRDLQRRLDELGYLNDSIDGIYGPRTRYAVMLFQDFNGMEATGVADKATQEMLFDTSMQLAYDPYRQISYGARGLRVTEMQERLRHLGYMADPADGIYGPYTRAGVKLFQQENGLNPTGVADSRTLSRLYDVTAPKCSSYFEMNYGDSGWRVEQLNKRLKKLYFLEGTPGSYYGSATRAAVKLFQRDNGLNQTGVASAYMQELLFSDRANEYSGYITLRRGDESNRVYQLQKRLKQLGYYEGNCTGYFGKYTYSCVRDFQKVAGLEVTGIADIETQELLFSRYAPEKPRIAVISRPYITVDDYIRKLGNDTYLVDDGYADITWYVDGDVDVYFYEIETTRGTTVTSGYTYNEGIRLNISRFVRGSTFKVTVYAIPENGSMNHAKSSYIYITTPDSFVAPETPVPTPEPLVTIEPTPSPEVTVEPTPAVAAPVISVSGDYTLQGNTHILGDGGAIFSWTEEENTAYDVIVTDEAGNTVFTPSLVSGGSVEISRTDLEPEKQYYLVVTAYPAGMTSADGKSVRVMLMAGEAQPDPTEEPVVPVVELIVSVTGADKISDVWQIGENPITVSWSVIGEVTDYNVELIDPNGFGLSSIMNTTQTSIELSSDYVVADKVYGLRITANAGEATVDETIYVTLKPAPVEEIPAEETVVEETVVEEVEATVEPEVTIEPEFTLEPTLEPVVEDEPIAEATEEPAPQVIVTVENTVEMDGVNMIESDVPAAITWSNTGDATEYSLTMTDDEGNVLQQVDRTPYTSMSLDGKGMEDGRVYCIRFVAHTSVGDCETTMAFGRAPAAGGADEMPETEDEEVEAAEEAVTEIGEVIVTSDTPVYDGVYQVGVEGFKLDWHAEGDIAGYDLSLYDGAANLLQAAQGVEYEELFFAHENLAENEIYSLDITAVPANGEAAAKSVTVYFTREAAQTEATEEPSYETEEVPDDVPVQSEVIDETEQPEVTDETEQPEVTDEAVITEQPEEVPEVYTVSAPSLYISGDYQLDGSVYTVETRDISFGWYAEGDVAGYNVYLMDEYGSVINSAMDISETALNLSEASIADDTVYTLRVVAVPVNGTEENGKSAELSFMRIAPQVVYSVSAPVINVEGYTYEEENLAFTFNDTLYISWYTEGDLNYYNIYLVDENDNLINQLLGTTHTELTLSADSLTGGMGYLFAVEAVPIGGTDGSGEVAVIGIFPEQQSEPEPESYEEEYIEEEYTEEEYVEEEYTEETYYEEEYVEEEYVEEEYYEEEYVEEEYYEEEYVDDSFTAPAELTWNANLDMMSDAEHITAYQQKLAEWGWLIVVPAGEDYNGEAMVPVATEGIFDAATMEATFNLQMYINELSANGENIPAVEIIDYTMDYPYVGLDLLRLIMPMDSMVQIINPNIY